MTTEAPPSGPLSTDGEEAQRHGLTSRVIAGCARRPWLTLSFALAMAVFGTVAFTRAPLDAIPDLSDTQVIIVTEWPGRSPDLIEDQLTYPISSALLAAPGVETVRGQSMFGLSLVYAIFKEGTDMYWARSRVLEYMDSAKGGLPSGVTPVLGPDATGVGWVYQYALVDPTGKTDVQELRALQDWNLRFALESVPGVAEVASVGGAVKEYQVVVDPVRLRAHRLSVGDIARAVRAANQDVGGRSLEIAGHEHMIRGRGYIRGLAELREIPVHVQNGVAVLLSDVADVTLGPAPRRGFTDLNGQGEVAGGIVVMRYGENALRVIDAVKERLEQLKPGLPKGVEVVETYDRSGLIRGAIGTLKTTLFEEMLVVSIIIFLFLLHARSALIPIVTLPLGVLLAFIPMFYQGLTINIMSLGGIAVAIGAMVDASVIIIENVHTRLAQWAKDLPSSEGSAPDAHAPSRHAVIVSAMQEVGPAVFFSLLIITVAFLPVFTLEGTTGRLFSPLAYTKTYSMGFAAVLAITVTPALAVLLIRGRVHHEDQHFVSKWLIRGYAPVVRFVVDYRKTVVGLSVAAMVLTIPAFTRLGEEFMPPLNEGTLLYMPTAPPGMSVTEAQNVLQNMDALLMEVPEVVSVFGKMGRADSSTDPAPIGMAETTLVLKPKEEWRPGLTWEALVEELDALVQYPGMPNIWWMPIQTRTEMLATGVRSPVGIQVFGDDLETVESASVAIERAVSRIPGTRSAFAERPSGGFYIDFQVNRERAARHGVNVQDVNDVIQTALGGFPVTETIEGRERYPVSVRYARELRDTPELLEEVLVTTNTGASVPIRQVADIEFVTGPDMIRSQAGQLVGFVFVDTDRPIADYVEDAKRAIAQEVVLPEKIRVDFVGQFKHLESAREKLTWVVPLALAIIVVLLYFNTRSWVATAIVLLAVPFSLIGAVWLVYLLDYNLSVAVWVGIIALAGLDAETGIVMLLYLTLAHKRRSRAGKVRHFGELREAIVEGAAKRIRPKLMTVATTGMGLLPILWSTGIGADVMKRIAAPMVGGLLTSFLLELTVYPALFAMWKGWGLRREGA